MSKLLCALCGEIIPFTASRYTTMDKYKICKNCLKKHQLTTLSVQQYLLNDLSSGGRLEEVTNQSRNAQRIEEQLSQLGLLDTFGTKKEIKSLPDYIDNDEDVKYVTSGFYDGNTILLVLTNQRMLFLDKGMLYGVNKIEIPIDKINSVSYKKGMLLSTLKMFNGAAPVEIKNIDNNTIERLTKEINSAIKEYSVSNSQPMNINQNSFSAADEIKKFKELLDLDVITQEEFNEKKKELLGL
ncbi:hypothetical protein EGCR1_09105 [Enterococcus gilvus]|jgi:hypothetical protein|uniref:PH domain-containing protein n=1 Tax=Enterococcus gilvus TaxID=160453 RepID=UPI000DF640CF|nr:PH domain-containing protein [Enterococcus gilvus]AXG38857.1 hypothetical protein EGCR1_09105 [Enterococcus gilvus]